jgi:hypothetical protein
VAAALLIAPASAAAQRPPTKAERDAIVRTADVTDGGAGYTVTLADIRVSTVGPWAAATATIRTKASVQVEEDTFYRGRRGWIDTGSAAFKSREIPSAVQDDLGLNGSGSGNLLVNIAVALGWLLALCGLVDVLLQPSGPFGATQRRKRDWLLIELLGAIPFAGYLTWGFYAARVRPALVGAGGRRPRAVLRAIGNAIASWERRAKGPPTPPTRPVRSHEHTHQPFEPERPSTKPCGGCGGSGRLTCFSCNGGRVPNPDHDPHRRAAVPWVNCFACGGPPGGRTCGTCHGSGRVPA